MSDDELHTVEPLPMKTRDLPKEILFQRDGEWWNIWVPGDETRRDAFLALDDDGYPRAAIIDDLYRRWCGGRCVMISIVRPGLAIGRDGKPIP